MLAFDVLGRSLEILAGGAVKQGKDYLSNINDLVTDANEIKTTITSGAKNVRDTYHQIKNRSGGITKAAMNWFFQRSNDFGQFDLMDGNADDDFDPGFRDDSSPDEENEAPSVIDQKSMKNIARGQVAAMYQIGGKQVEANLANTAEIVSTFNNRSCEIIASINNLNKSLLAISDNLNKISTAIISSDTKEEETRRKNSILRNGRVTLGTLFNSSVEAIKDNPYIGLAKTMVSMGKMGMGPEDYAQMLLSGLVFDKVKIGGKSINQWGEGFNKAVGNWMNDIFSHILESDLVKRYIGDFTKRRPEDYRDYYEQSDYNREKAVFDGMTRKSIVDIIPNYLKEITQSITGLRYEVDSKGNLTTKKIDMYVETNKRYAGQNLISYETRDAIKEKFKESDIGNQIDARVLQELEKLISFGYTWVLYSHHESVLSIGTAEQYKPEVINIVKQEWARRRGISGSSNIDTATIDTAIDIILSEIFVDSGGSKIHSGDFVASLQKNLEEMYNKNIELGRSKFGNQAHVHTLGSLEQAFDAYNNPNDVVSQLNTSSLTEIQKSMILSSLSESARRIYDSDKDLLHGKLTERGNMFKAMSGDLKNTNGREETYDEAFNRIIHSLGGKYADVLEEQFSDMVKRHQRSNDEESTVTRSHLEDGTSIGSLVTNIWKKLNEGIINVRIVRKEPPSGSGNFPSMNMDSRGCGPTALADLFNRKNGLDPESLAQNMYAAGMYNPNAGTNVRDYILAARGMGMNLYPGMVTGNALKTASPYHPITLLGSGYGFGTNHGNLHYMNIIGSSGSSVYASNPMYGGIRSFPASIISGNSILGLYGSGDSDDDNKGLGDVIDDKMKKASDWILDPNNNNFFARIFREGGFDSEDFEEFSEVVKRGGLFRFFGINAPSLIDRTRRTFENLGNSASESLTNEVKNIKSDAMGAIKNISDARHARRDLIREGNEYASSTKTRMESSVLVSDKDREYANEALQLMQAALADGDGKADLAGIIKVVNKIENKDLKQDLNMNISRLIRNSAEKTQKPAKSKLGKILLWGFGLVKRFLSPVITVIKTAMLSVGAFIKNHGKKILKFIARPYVKGAALIASGTKDIFEGVFGGKKTVEDEYGKRTTVRDKGVIGKVGDAFKETIKYIFDDPLFKELGKLIKGFKDAGGILLKTIKTAVTFPGKLIFGITKVVGEYAIGLKDKLDKGLEDMGKSISEWWGGVRERSEEKYQAREKKRVERETKWENERLEREEKRKLEFDKKEKEREEKKEKKREEREKARATEKYIDEMNKSDKQREKDEKKRKKEDEREERRKNDSLTLLDKLHDVINNIGKNFSTIFKGIKNDFEKAFKGIRSATSGILGSLKGFANRTLYRGSQLITRGTANAVTGFFGGVGKSFAEGHEFVKGFTGKVLGGKKAETPQTMSDKYTKDVSEMISGKKKSIFTRILEALTGKKDEDDKSDEKAKVGKKDGKKAGDEKGEEGKGSKKKPGLISRIGDKLSDRILGKNRDASDKVSGYGADKNKSDKNKDIGKDKAVSKSRLDDLNTNISDTHQKGQVDKNDMGSNKSSGGGGRAVSGFAKAGGAIGTAVAAIGKVLGGISKVVFGFVKMFAAAVAQLSSVKIIMNSIGRMVSSIVRPLGKVIAQLWKALKPVLVLAKTLLKNLVGQIGDVILSLMETLKPVLGAIMDVLPTILGLISDTIIPIYEWIVKTALAALVPIIVKVIAPGVKLLCGGISVVMNWLKSIAGSMEVGLGNLLNMLGNIFEAIGKDELSEDFRNSANTLIASGEKVKWEGKHGVVAGIRQMKEGWAELGKGPAEDANKEAKVEYTTADTSDRFSSDRTGGSVMEGNIAPSVITNSTTTNIDNSTTITNNSESPTITNTSESSGDESTVYNTYGSGMGSQYTYGSYMNMKDHGCGPVALADRYSRRTGRSVSPTALVGSMAASGNYNSNRGTTVGSFVNMGRSMGMNMTVGGVNNRSLRQATPSNPITVVGSGGAFGTRTGNNHYMNVVGSDGSGHAYVSNPIRGGVSKVSISDISNHSIAGIYGSGDVEMTSPSDIASKDPTAIQATWNVSDTVADLIAQIQELASNFFSFLTGQSSYDAAMDSNSKAIEKDSTLERLDDEQREKITQMALDSWKSENPKLETETEQQYMQRYTNKIKNEYEMRVATQMLAENAKKDALSDSTVEAALNDISESNKALVDLYKERSDAITSENSLLGQVKAMNSKLDSIAAASSGGAAGGYGGYDKEDLIRATAMVYEGYINANSSGGYSNGLYGKQIHLRNGVVRQIRPDCSGLVSAGIQEMGYKLKGAGESGLRSWDFAGATENTIILNPDGSPSTDWVVLPFKREDLQRGDITAGYWGSHGHVSLPITNLQDDWPKGLDGGGTSNIKESAKAAVAYLDGSSDIPWRTAMGPKWCDQGGAQKIWRYVGRPISGGRITMTDLMSKYNAFPNFKAKFERPNPDTGKTYHEEAVEAGLTPGQEAYIAGVGMIEDSARKLVGEKSLTRITKDVNGQKAFGISNWIPVNEQNGHDYTYGSTLHEQLQKGFMVQYFGDNPTKPRARITENYSSYKNALEEAIGTSLKLNRGDLWGKYLDSDLPEATGHGVGNAVVPGEWQLAKGHAKYIGSAAGYYNWMIDQGYIDPGAETAQIALDNRAAGQVAKASVANTGLNGTKQSSSAAETERLKSNRAAISAANGIWSTYKATVPGIYYDFYNSAGEWLFAAYNESGQDPNAVSAFNKANPGSLRVVVTRQGDQSALPEKSMMRAYDFSNTPASLRAKEQLGGDIGQYVGTLSYNGNYSSPTKDATAWDVGNGSIAVNDATNDLINQLQKVYVVDETEKRVWDPSKVSSANMTHWTKNQFHKVTDPLLKMYKYSEGEQYLRHDPSNKDTSFYYDRQQHYFPGVYYKSSQLRDTGRKSQWTKMINAYDKYASGDSAEMYIPPLNDNIIGDYFANGLPMEGGNPNVNNNYYIARDEGDSIRDHLTELLNHTFDVRSESIEAILTEMLNEIKSRKNSSTPQQPQTPPQRDLFDNNRIPSQIEKLLVGKTYL